MKRNYMGECMSSESDEFKALEKEMHQFVAERDLQDEHRERIEGPRCSIWIAAQTTVDKDPERSRFVIAEDESEDDMRCGWDNPIVISDVEVARKVARELMQWAYKITVRRQRARHG